MSDLLTILIPARNEKENVNSSGSYERLKKENKDLNIKIEKYEKEIKLKDEESKRNEAVKHNLVKKLAESQNNYRKEKDKSTKLEQENYKQKEVEPQLGKFPCQKVN